MVLIIKRTYRYFNSSLRVVSNFGDGDSGTGRMKCTRARARNFEQTLLLALPLLAGDDFRARACIFAGIAVVVVVCLFI